MWVGSVTVTHPLRGRGGTTVSYGIGLYFTHLPSGGSRWWECPACERRVDVLDLPADRDRFACRRLVRWLAAGLGTRAKALITTRFPLPDLAAWAGRGFRPTDLSDPGLEAAPAGRIRTISGRAGPGGMLHHRYHRPGRRRYTRGASAARSCWQG